MTTLGDDGSIATRVATGRPGALQDHLRRIADDPRLDGRRTYPSREAAPPSCTAPSARPSRPIPAPAPFVDPGVDWGDDEPGDDAADAAGQGPEPESGPLHEPDPEPEPEPEPPADPASAPEPAPAVPRDPTPAEPPAAATAGPAEQDPQPDTEDEQRQGAGPLASPTAAGESPPADAQPEQLPADLPPLTIAVGSARIEVRCTTDAETGDVAVVRLDLAAIAALLGHALAEQIDLEAHLVQTDGDTETGELLFAWSPPDGFRERHMDTEPPP